VALRNKRIRALREAKRSVIEHLCELIQPLLDG
jgi:hypothetical protein